MTWSRHKDNAYKRSVGPVVRVRMNPRDVMSCIDCANAAGIDLPYGMSMAAVIKKGISIALATLRAEKVIPEHDGFEYSQMIQPFAGASKTEISLKVKNSQQIVIQEQREEAMDVQPAALPSARRTTPSEEDIAKGVRRRRLFPRMQELQFREKNDKENFSKRDKEELRKIEEEIAS